MTDFTEIDAKNRDAWNAAHAVHHEGALSGSDPKEVLDHHRIAGHVRPGIVVLDIGIGQGGMAKHLVSQGCTVDSLDVSDEAAKTVAGTSRGFYLADDIDTLPSGEYDMAISHLVAQHMCERNLRKQIANVFRALKPGGMFSLHLAGATEGPLNNLTCEIPSGMDGAMCRDPEYAESMIRDVLQSGFSLKVLDHRMEWPQFKSYWYFVHVIKENP